MQAQCSPGELIARHCHPTAYAAVILKGGYEEAGFEGRRTVCAGDVLVHHAFDSHLDRIGPRGADVLNIMLPAGSLTDDVCAGHIADPDALARLHRSDPLAARAMLIDQFRPALAPAADWPELLRQRLSQAVPLSLARWASEQGLARETISRGFSSLYGIPPAAFRREARARQAWRRIVSEATPLAAIAADTGFADQPHMTRAVAALTGRTPGAWRSHSFKTGPAARD
jgi:AraC-like DNA-binding protein